MNLNYNPNIIKGLRILVANPPYYDQYFVQYEFSGKTWRESAKAVLPNLIDRVGVRIQTAHPYILGDDNDIDNCIWMYNESIFVYDL